MEVCSTCKKYLPQSFGRYFPTHITSVSIFKCQDCFPPRARISFLTNRNNSDKSFPAVSFGIKNPKHISPQERKLFKPIAWMAHEIGAGRVVSQFPIARCVYDFGFPSIRLLVELDSRSYHRTAQQKSRDRYKNKIAERCEWTLKRIKGGDLQPRSEVLAQFNLVIRQALAGIDAPINEEPTGRNSRKYYKVESAE